MAKAATISNRETKQTRVGRKVSDIRMTAATQTDAPEFIKSRELTKIPKFTIYGADERNGQYGTRIYFQLFWKDSNGEKVKRVWTPTANDERRVFMRECKKEPIINCRLIEVPTNGTYDYFKIIDADDDVEKIIAEAVEQLKRDSVETQFDEDIPF